MNQDTEKGSKPLQKEFRKILAPVLKENTPKSSTKVMNQDIKKGPKPLKEEFREIVAPVLKENTPESSTKMSQDIKKRSKPLQEELKEIVAPILKENSPEISTKATRRRYGPHSGIKFNFNRKPNLVVKPFSFDSRAKNEKGSTSVAARNITGKQANKEENINPDDRVETSAENLKITKTLDKANNKSIASGSALESYPVLPEKEEIELCNNMIEAFGVIKPVPQMEVKGPSRVMRSSLSTPVKPQRKPQVSNTSKLPSSIVVEPRQPSKESKLQQISKHGIAQPAKSAKPETPTIKKAAKNASAATGERK